MAPTEKPKPLYPYWVSFENNRPTAGCYEGESLEAVTKQAEEMTNAKVASIDSLPYPAEPRQSVTQGRCPSFCYSPDQCKGRGSCPKSYACCE